MSIDHFTVITRRGYIIKAFGAVELRSAPQHGEVIASAALTAEARKVLSTVEDTETIYWNGARAGALFSDGTLRLEGSERIVGVGAEVSNG